MIPVLHPKLYSMKWPVLITRPLPRAGDDPAPKQKRTSEPPPLPRNAAKHGAVPCYQEPPQEAAVTRLASEAVFGAALATAYQQVLRLREQNGTEPITK